MIQQVDSVLINQYEEVDAFRYELLMKDAISIFQLNLRTKLFNSCI